MGKSTIIFEGHVMPAKSAPEGEKTLRMKQNEDVTWDFVIQNDKFKVVRKGEFTSLESILNEAVILTAAIVRAQALESDQPLDVEFTDWIETDRDTPPSPIVGDIRTTKTRQPINIEVIERSVDNARFIATLPALRWAVEDYNTALKLRNEAPFFCFKAVESLRSYFDVNDDRERGWENLRNSLGVEREFLDYLTDRSKEVRHGAQQGQTVEIKPEVSADCIRRCKTVINKFLDFIKQGQAEWHS